MAKTKTGIEADVAKVATDVYQVVTNLKHDGVHYGPKLKKKTVQLTQAEAKGLVAKGVVKPVTAAPAAAAPAAE